MRLVLGLNKMYLHNTLEGVWPTIKVQEKNPVLHPFPCHHLPVLLIPPPFLKILSWKAPPRSSTEAYLLSLVSLFLFK